MEPLAVLLRPQTLDDVFGQRHLLSHSSVFYKMIAAGTVPNMIFYGPSGVGKTTVARIIAKNSGMSFHALNGTTASTADIREVIASVGTLMGQGGVLLYLDEIQYLNKKQQQTLLEFIEGGSVTLIATTTENPHFYVYNALLSRCTVFEFRRLDTADIEAALDRAAAELAARGRHITFAGDTRRILASAAAGDVRKALNFLELLIAAEPGDAVLTEEAAGQVTAFSSALGDRADDNHYNLLSAFQKSIRGSDPDAALHYLARLLVAGDLISPCRRLLVIASEDIGLAYPQAAAIVNACVDSAFRLGLPEAAIPLAEAVVLLATAPKSNASYMAYQQAAADVEAGRYSDVPDHLKSSPVTRGEPYKYAHDYKNHYVVQQYMPDALVGKKYYRYGDNKTEQAARAYWERILTQAKESQP